MSTQLAIAVQRAEAHVRADASGRLPLGRRELIYAAIGPREGAGANAAHEQRTELALRTCRHVLPLWERDRLGDRGPHRMLELAAAVRSGNVAEEAATAEIGRFWGHVENLTQLAGDPSRVSVGFACAKAVNVALYDEWFGARPDPSAGDDLTDLDAADTAYVAAMAAAGGLPRNPQSDPAARRAFWLWWLATAFEIAR